MADEPKMDDVMLAALKARRAKFNAECERAIADIDLALHEAMEGPLSPPGKDPSIPEPSNH
jgi:hypothetical protein